MGGTVIGVRVDHGEAPDGGCILSFVSSLLPCSLSECLSYIRVTFTTQNSPESQDQVRSLPAVLTS